MATTLKFQATERGGGFDELRQSTDADALAILKNPKQPKYKSDTDQGKAINLYKSILDTVGRNKLGIAPLKPYLKDWLLKQ
jgi:endothelin-converting enzyme/putative endopeptidase